MRRDGAGTMNAPERRREAAREAIEEAQVPPAEIDAVFLGHFNSGLAADGFASSLVHQAHPDLRFTPAARCENACASGAAAIHAGMNAIRAGKARTVLVVGAEKMTHRSTPDVTAALAGAGYQNDPAEAALSFPQVFGLAAAGYAERHREVVSRFGRFPHRNATLGREASDAERLFLEQPGSSF